MTITISQPWMFLFALVGVIVSILGTVTIIYVGYQFMYYEMWLRIKKHIKQRG
jgi:hypothetical protein